MLIFVKFCFIKLLLTLVCFFFCVNRMVLYFEITAWKMDNWPTVIPLYFLLPCSWNSCRNFWNVAVLGTSNRVTVIKQDLIHFSCLLQVDISQSHLSHYGIIMLVHWVYDLFGVPIEFLFYIQCSYSDWYLLKCRSVI